MSPLASTRPARRAGAEPTLRPYIFLSVAAVVFLCGVTWWFIANERRSAIEYWQAVEGGIADVIVNRLSEWLEDSRGDAEMLASMPSVVVVLSGTPTDRPSFRRELREHLPAYLDQMVETRYVTVHVFDAAGRAVERSTDVPPVTPDEAAVAQAVARDGKFRIDLDGNVPEHSVVTFTAPVRSRPGAGPILGAVMLKADLTRSVFPLLKADMEVAATAETVLVRREGDEVVFINPLPERPAGSPRLRIPFASAGEPLQDALGGAYASGIYEGRRGVQVIGATRSLPSKGWALRGVEVIGATRSLPSLGWALAREIDLDEALGEFYRRAWRESIIAGLVVLIVGVLLRSEWQRIRVRLLAAEAESSQTSRHLAAIVQSSTDAIISTTLDGVVTTWNTGAERLYGFTAADVIGRPIAMLVPEEHHDDVRTLIERAARGASGPPCDHVRMHKDGRALDVSVTISPIGDEAGEIFGVSIIATDVGPRKQAERVARASALYGRSLIEASLDPLVTIDVEGRITDVNAATERATGVPRSQLVGTDFCDYFTEPRKARESYRTVFAHGVVQDFPLTMRHVSGRTMDVLYNASVYRNEAGAVQGVFAAARDVTERTHQQRELRRTLVELTRSNEELQQFAYVASHDLQEPLRMVASYVELLARRYKGKLDADADEFIGYAVDGALRMRQLIDDLLNYARVGARSGTGAAAVDSDRVLQTVLDGLRDAIASHDAVVSHDRLPRVLVEETDLATLLRNLIDNGIKFHGDAPPRIHVGAERHDRTWRFMVRDNGIGISPDDARRLFVVFRRLHARSKYAGTGIGLASCKRIVERHGGRIWVESTPGRGSTFYFTLADAAAEAPSPRVMGRSLEEACP